MGKKRVMKAEKKRRKDKMEIEIGLGNDVVINEFVELELDFAKHEEKFSCKNRMEKNRG